MQLYEQILDIFISKTPAKPYNKRGKYLLRHIFRQQKWFKFLVLALALKRFFIFLHRILLLRCNFRAGQVEQGIKPNDFHVPYSIN